MDTGAIFECRNLFKNYGNVAALRGVNLDVRPGRIVGLLGPNGSGKTTLIKLCAGLLTPTMGEIYIDGVPVSFETKAAVSYLPEFTYFSEWMRVFECLDYFADFYADFDRARACEMLAALGVDTKAKMKTLSKGTKEKVQLVLVMSRKARLYLLDEPIGGVDPASRDYILNTIIGNYSPQSSVIISTHLIADVESVLDDFFFINYGSVVMSGSVDEARTQHGKSIDQLFREVFKC